MVVIANEIVGVIAVTRLKLGSLGWKIPMVFRVEGYLALVTNEVQVLQIGIPPLAFYILQYGVVVIKVIAPAQAKVEVADVKVERNHSHGVLVVNQVDVSCPLVIDVDVLMTELIGYVNFSPGAGIQCKVGFGHGAFAQSQGKVGCHGDGLASHKQPQVGL